MYKMCKLSTLILLIPLLLFAQQRGVKVITRSGQSMTLYSGSYALVIGESDYTAGWDDLLSVPAEVKEVAAALESMGFTVIIKMNLDGEELKDAFEQFINQYGYKRNYRLLFYFSGHGFSRMEGSKGYLVPTDAPDPRRDEEGFLRRALPMTQILSWSRQMEAKHVLFIFDSCFSGTVFKAKMLENVPLHITSVTTKSVRQFITAGSANEPVPAKSVFTPSFIRGITREADLNRDGYVTGTELGMYLHDKVIYYGTGQTPQYGKIRDPELDEGDFVFVLDNFRNPSFRITPALLSESMVRSMLITNNFYSKGFAWNRTFCNPNGTGIVNQYELRHRGQVVSDRATSLMWQQSGSNDVPFEEAKVYVDRLNQKGFAGYSDWRLPTLEEAMTLVERYENSNGLYTDSKFDKEQGGIWTSDRYSNSEVWVVDLRDGYCEFVKEITYKYYTVRAVRSAR